MKIDLRSRRAFLQGLGRATLAVPFLPSLLPSHAQAAERQMKLVWMYTKYGRPQNQWFNNPAPMTPAPDESYRSRTLSDIPGDLSPCLGPAFDTSVRKKLAIVRGLDPYCKPFAHTSAFAGTGDAGDGRSASFETYGRFGYSFDAVVEESPRFYATAPAASAIRTVPAPKKNLYLLTGWSYSHKSGAIRKPPWLNEPKDVYDKYFNAQVAAVNQARSTRLKDVTNVVHEDFKRTIAGRRISAHDKIRLDNFMNLLAEVQGKLGGKLVSCSRTQEAERQLAALDNYDKYHDVAMDLEAAALACGITKIVVHGIGQWRPDMAEIDPPWHDIGHSGAQEKTNGPRKIGAAKWQSEKVAAFIKKLDAIVEPDGNTLLDNTLLVYNNDDSTGGHFLMDLPILIAGAKGKIKTDQIIDYRNLNDPYKGASCSSGMGKDFFWGRPYNNLFMTAFKTLGLVKEDYTKYAGQDGFGMYDGGYGASKYTKWVSTSSERHAPLPGLWIGG